MRINSGDVTDSMEIQLDQSHPSREVADSAKTSTAGNSSGTSDSIALTGVGGIVQLALGAGAAQRADRVQQLKQLVNSNQYSIDPESVARALIGAHMTGG